MKQKFAQLGLVLSREQSKRIVGGDDTLEDSSDQTKNKCDSCQGYMPACCYVTVDCCYDSAGKCCNK